MLTSALVDSSRVTGRDEAERALLTDPLALAGVADLDGLRRRLTSAQGGIGQAAGAKRLGNNRKRIRLRVELPGPCSAAELARALAEPAVSPDVRLAIESADRAAGRPSRGQGLGLTAAEKTAVERRAVDLAVAHLAGLGYDVLDVGAKQSYDLHATRSGETLHVEVKGTTSAGGEVVLTRKEVEFMTREHPRTMLIVVSGIELDRSGPTAAGGTLDVRHPWRIDPADLTPISYRYAVPRP